MAQFIITFGQGDRERRNCFTVVEAEDTAAATERGYELYQNRWSMAYPEEQGYEMVKRWGLTYIPPGS